MRKRWPLRSGHPGSSLQDDSSPALCVFVSGGVFVCGPAAVGWAADAGVFRDRMDHGVRVRVLIDAEWGAVRIVLLYGIDRRAGAVPVQHSVHGFALVHVPSVCQLLRGALAVASSRN